MENLNDITELCQKLGLPNNYFIKVKVSLLIKNDGVFTFCFLIKNHEES